MRTILGTIVIIFLVCLFGCHPSKYLEKREALEAAIYIKIIDEQFSSEQLIILHSTTIPGPMGEILSRREARLVQEVFGEQLDAETMADLRSHINDEVLISSQLQTKVPYKLIDTEEIKQIFDQGMGWEGLEARFPGARVYLKLSRVGFNKERDQAIVYREISGGGRSGGGEFILLQYGQSGWIIEEVVRSWIS